MIASLSRTVCPVCDSVCQAWARRGGREYERCPWCGTIRMADPPSDDELDALYRDAVFTLPGNDQYYDDDRGNLAAAHARRRWMERSAAGGRLLDVGCGFGHFLAALDPQRWDARGIDVSPHGVAQARRRFGVRCEARRLDQVPSDWDGGFDVVTMWDVIEHVRDPLDAVTSACRMLRPGGRLFMSTPDASAWAARLLGRRWHYLDPMQHLCLFNRRSLAGLCGRAGLTVVRRRSFGRHYAAGYLMYRAAYCYPVPGARALAAAGRRAIGPLARVCVPVKLGDIVAVEAVRAEGEAN